ncbi:MAG: methyltransferase domain-containing protein [Candidatus Altiarchaeota archaeon]|nr:methyltransferase domain-containing protein [Candidatus Altiarchaeota archaeon]
MMLLVDDHGNTYLIKGDAEFHTKYGLLTAAQIKNAKPGDLLTSNTGRTFHVIEPNITDYVQKASRGPQAMTLKDLSIIAGFTGLHSGSRVLEAGTGSGVLSIFLANIVAPAVLSTYDIREDFAEIARKNFAKFGITNIEAKLKDIYSGIDETDLDLVTLDLAEPWLAVPHATKALKIGGYLSSYSPSISQSKKLVDSLGEGYWHETFETLKRDWKMDAVRPHTQMLGHTGFITIARLLSR